MWAEEIDDITVEYEEDGVVVVKEEGREIISRSSWPVVLFRYREYNKTSEDYGPMKYSLRKFRKRNGVYKMESKFNIGSARQAADIAKTLAEWAAQDVDSL